MRFRSLVLVPPFIMAMSLGSFQPAVAGYIVAPMIVADNQKKAQERDARLAPAPRDRCSGCHQEILPFSSLPILPDTTILGHNATKVSPDWTENEVASIQWLNADNKVNWTRVKIYTRDKGRINRVYTYEVPYQTTRFFLPAKGMKNPHKVLDE